MSRAARMGAALEGGRARAGLTVQDLWIRYCSLGGTAGLGELAAYLSGASAPSDGQYDVVAQALNDEFLGLGLDHPVPYSDGVAGAP